MNPRLLLITSLSLTGQKEADAAQGGRPAMQAGDPETVLQAYAYVLADTPVAELDAPADDDDGRRGAGRDAGTRRAPDPVGAGQPVQLSTTPRPTFDRRTWAEVRRGAWKDAGTAALTGSTAGRPVDDPPDGRALCCAG